MKPNVLSKISSVFVLIITLLIMLVPKADSHIRLSHIFHKQSSRCVSVVQNINGFTVKTVPERNLILTIGIKDSFYMYHTESKMFICISKRKKIQARMKPALHCKFKDMPVMDGNETTPYTKFLQENTKDHYLAFTKAGQPVNLRKRHHNKGSSNVFLINTKHQDDDHTSRELKKLCAVRKHLSSDIKSLCNVKFQQLKKGVAFIK